MLITVNREPSVFPLQTVVNCEELKSYKKLLRVAAYVLRFRKGIRSKKLQVKAEFSENLSVGELGVKEISEAELLWVICVQSVTKEDSKYEHLVHQLSLFTDERGIIHSRSRLQKSMLPYETKSPMLLPRNNYFTKLVILRIAIAIALHCGVKNTPLEKKTKKSILW